MAMPERKRIHHELLVRRERHQVSVVTHFYGPLVTQAGYRGRSGGQPPRYIEEGESALTGGLHTTGNAI